MEALISYPTIIAIIIGVFVTVFVSYVFHSKSRFETQETKHQGNIEQLEAEFKRKLASVEAPVLQDFRNRINLPIISEKFSKKYESLLNLNIELDISETSRVWSQLFGERNVIFLRATSRIDPEIWADEFMRKYVGEQRKLVDQIQSFRQTSESEYEDIIGRIKSKSGDELAKFNNLETNFERIFIIMNEQVQNAITLKKLAEIISYQSIYMDVKFVHEKKVAPEDTKDFGIVISRAGDILVYELNIIGEILYGGRIFYQPERISEAIDRYNLISTLATSVPRNSTSGEVIDELNEIGKASGTVIQQNVIEEAKRGLSVHKCLYCFLSTEVVMKSMSKEDWGGFPADAHSLCEKVAIQYKDKDWRNFPLDERRWFEVTDIENKKVLEYVVQNKPKRIIEIGCGPGRLISQILTIKDYEYDEIVGIDGDQQMYALAYQRFPPAEYPKVNLFHMRVENKLPYPDNCFDLCINAMNIVGWQKNREVDWLKEMMRCSYTTFFTVYKKGRENERLKMYRTRPHRRDGVRLDQEIGQIQLTDCATNPGVYSWAYERGKVEDICEVVASRYAPEYVVTYNIDDRANDILYLCFISKNKK